MKPLLKRLIIDLMLFLKNKVYKKRGKILLRQVYVELKFSYFYTPPVFQILKTLLKEIL